jgi:hypothetical protein
MMDEDCGSDIGGFDDSSGMDLSGGMDDFSSGFDDSSFGADMGSETFEISEDIGGDILSGSEYDNSPLLDIPEDVPDSEGIIETGEISQDVESIPEDIDDIATIEDLSETITEEINDNSEEVEIGGHQGMTLEEVQQYQEDNADAFIHEDDEKEFANGFSEETFNEEYENLQSEIRGDVDWPNNDGVVEGTEHDVELQVGDEITRREHSGHPNLDGSYAGIDDISFEESSLPGEESDYDTHHLEVTEELPDDYHISGGEVAPAFDHEGGGEQIHITRDNWMNPDAEPLDVPIQDLSDYGYLEETRTEEEIPQSEEVDE